MICIITLQRGSVQWFFFLSFFFLIKKQASFSVVNNSRDRQHGTSYQGLMARLLPLIEDNKSCQPEVKASRSDKLLRRYAHLKIALCSRPHFGKYYSLQAPVLLPTRKVIDNPASLLFQLPLIKLSKKMYMEHPFMNIQYGS